MLERVPTARGSFFAVAYKSRTHRRTLGYMSITPHGVDWWLAFDGRWYPPEWLSAPPGSPPPPSVDASSTSQPVERVRRPGVVFMWIVLGFVGAAWLLGGLGSSNDVGIGPGDRATRCEPAPRVLLDAIESRLRLDILSLRDGFVVRSDDWPAIWFVAAEIDGSGLEQRGNVGVWVTDDASLGAGAVLAVNYLARGFSGGADANDARGLSMNNDGAREAQLCEQLR